jgi:predicted ATPase
MRDYEWPLRLILNGTAIRLGTVSDVVDKVHGRHTFEVGVTDQETTCHWSFVGERGELSMALDQVKLGRTLTRAPKALRYLLPLKASKGPLSLARRLRTLTYLTAERIGPREVYDLEDRQVASVVGPAGEHATSVLHWGREEPVLDSLALDSKNKTRLHQVGQRMQTFFPGCGLDLQQVVNANAITLGLRVSADTDFNRPINVGFGLTQVFPIIVAALSAKEGDMLLIENPEVHLHPAGQALMGEFLADVARAGIQVIVESHSDHVLNGVRRSVKTARLKPEQVVIHFFRPRSTEIAQVVSPQLDRLGNIDAWPEGFFDQFDKDMNYFAGWASE